MLDIKSILSKNLSLAIIAILIGLAAIAYHLKGHNVFFTPKTTIEAKDQDNSGLKIYEDTITAKDTVSEPKEWLSNKKLPL